MRKTEEVRQQSKDKDKLIKDFRYVIESDLNTWFKRKFLSAFIDNWINKDNNSYELNSVWSRAAIEKKIAIMQINVEQSNTKKCQEFNNEHTIPRVFFEDIFIDGPTLEISPDRKIAHKDRMTQAYAFFEKLKKQAGSPNYNTFLADFFNKFTRVVTLTKGEHSVLRSQTRMPDSFFTTQNVWERYMDWGGQPRKCGVCKEQTNCMINPIELYEVDFSMNTISNIDWNRINLDDLINYNIVKGPLVH